MKFEDEWKRFEAAAVPSYADIGQRSDLRDAFYAGALSMIALQLSTPDGREWLAIEWAAEVEKYCADRAHRPGVKP